MVDALRCRSAVPRGPTAPVTSFSHQDSAKGRTAASRRIVDRHQHAIRRGRKGGSTLLFLANEREKENDGNTNNLWNGVAQLWDEIIEVSTYGPSERKMLKAQRGRQRELNDRNNFAVGDSSDNQNNANDVGGMSSRNDDDDGAWMDAFAAAKDANADEITINGTQLPLDFDGYAMQDLLLSKWNMPLDIDFQRTGRQIYCTVLPQLGYGGGPLTCRFDTELNYLMHLQGVVEVLHKYDQLEGFISFVEGTRKVPKRGTDSVPFRLRLSEEGVGRIVPKRKSPADDRTVERR